jgi:flagellar hook-basal body complex protein FliE
MSFIPTTIITPSSAVDSYQRVDSGDAGGTGSNFGAALQSALDEAVAIGNTAETSAVQAISGEGNLTAVVTALSRADLALQTATAIRDRIVQAYQDIMKMPI